MDTFSKFELTEELREVLADLSDIWIAVERAGQYLSTLEVEARCTSCHKVTYIEGPVHSKHREVTCDHCGHFFWLGALYVSNDKPAVISKKLTVAMLAVHGYNCK